MKQKFAVTTEPRESKAKGTGERADALILLVHSTDASPPKLRKGAALEALDALLDGSLESFFERVRFNAERGSVKVVPTLGRLPYAELVVVGVGPAPLRPSLLTESVAVGVRASLQNRPRRVAVDIADIELAETEPLLGLDRYGLAGLGATLGAYQYARFFGEKQRAQVTLEKIIFLADKAEQKAVERGVAVADGVCLARDLVNEPPNELYPESFAQRARSIAKSEGLDCKVLDERGLAQAGMNLHLAVGRGSTKKPRFVHLTYRPPSAKGRAVFVGKGITFDSGGLCIKPMQGMADMKSDMAGAAAVLGMMSVVSKLNLPIEVHGILGLAENMPDGDAYRPSDVITSLSGKGVEIINTDAEGRLVLADALTYASRLEPDFIVDAATLTGATLISLGPSYSAFFTGQDELSTAMTEAAQTAGENFWRMPLIEELAQELKSDVTDLQHTGQRYGGAISAALFLREFVDGKPWIHADVPGPTFRDRAAGLHPKGGTGHGVLTFLELAFRHAAKPLVARPDKQKSSASPSARPPKKSESTRPARAGRGSSRAGVAAAPKGVRSSKSPGAGSPKTAARRAGPRRKA